MPSSTSSSSVPAEVDVGLARVFARRAGKLILFASLVLLGDRAIDWGLRWGALKSFGLDRPATVLCVGHSRTLLGIDGELLEQRLRVPVTKYAIQGASVYDRSAMIQHCLGLWPGAVRVVVYDVDPTLLTPEKLSSNSYQLFFPFMDHPDIDRFVRSQSSSWKDHWMRRVLRTSRYGDDTFWLAVRGLLGIRSNFRRGTVDLERVNRQINAGKFPSVRVTEGSLRCFEETIRLARAHGIGVVLLYVPRMDVLNDTDRAGERMVVAKFQALADSDPGVVFLNYSPIYEHSYDLFFDAIHMNPEGQKAVTDRLAEDLRRILSVHP